MKKLIAQEIDFTIAQVESFCMSENSILTINFNLQRGKLLKIIFSHAIQFSYKLGNIIKNIYEIPNHSSFLEEALSEYYVSIPTNHPFKLFHIEDMDDLPLIEVVAESVYVMKE
jgi:hypothetical protein